MESFKQIIFFMWKKSSNKFLREIPYEKEVLEEILKEINKRNPLCLCGGPNEIPAGKS